LVVTLVCLVVVVDSRVVVEVAVNEEKYGENFEEEEEEEEEAFLLFLVLVLVLVFLEAKRVPG